MLLRKHSDPNLPHNRLSLDADCRVSKSGSSSCSSIPETSRIFEQLPPHRQHQLSTPQHQLSPPQLQSPPSGPSPVANHTAAAHTTAGDSDLEVHTTNFILSGEKVGQF